MVRDRLQIRGWKKKALGAIGAGRFDEAFELLAKVCTADARDAEAAGLLGAVCGQLGRFEAAIRYCRSATALAPDYVDAWFNLAQACMHLHRLDESVAAYRRVVQLAPEHAEALNNLGYALEKLGEYQAALNHYRRAVHVRPDYADAYCNLGNLMHNQSQGSKTDGLDFLRLATTLKPDVAKYHMYLGGALQSSGRFEEAIAALDQAAALEPGNTEIVGARALALEKRGDFAPAFELLRPYLNAGSTDLHIARAFATVARHVDRRAESVALLEDIVAAGGLRDDDALVLHFQLGKLYDEGGDYDRAFEHFRAGNALKRTGYDPARVMREFDQLIAFFNHEFLARVSRAGSDSALPVFIVGMPRSGTSLVEQILASHPAVFGAGELTWMEDIAASIPARQQSRLPYPQCLGEARRDVLDRLAQEHLQRLVRLAPDALRVTDKMPHNFRYLGLIQILFPHARVIHCTRHPLDTCLSIYSYDFNAMHGYATNLSWLGEYYRKYAEVMAHWKSVLSIPLLEVRYEELVADPDAGIRRLVEFVGLEWDDRCLRFHENRRSVNTISYDQVRRPIYRKSVARWERYGAHLDPLREALGDIR